MPYDYKYNTRGGEDKNNDEGNGKELKEADE